MLAVVSRVRTSGVADLEAELSAAHEVVPLDHLLERVVVAAVGSESVGVNETNQEGATEVSTVGVELSSAVTILDVNLLWSMKPTTWT